MGQRITNEKGEVEYLLSEAEYRKCMFALAHRELEEAEDDATGVERLPSDGKGGLTTEEIMALAMDKAKSAMEKVGLNWNEAA